MTNPTETDLPHGAVIDVPLNKLKPSPRNARRTPHARADIEALAASIAAKGMIQPIVVEPELDARSKATGHYLVTIGEGRRQAMQLRAETKAIPKTEPVRCIIDLDNDAHEISLDENVTRAAMHPADQFEAFNTLALRRGFGPEEIAARFGVSAQVVRQRLRLAKVSPALMAVYRQDDMTLDQLMAFTVTDDHARQEATWEALSWNKEPYIIRRMLTQDRVRGSDRRAVFVGAEAYEAAGGLVERDLFADDGGGYFTDPVLLDRLVLEKLESLAQTVRSDGWAWVTTALDLPPVREFRRVYPVNQPLLPEDEASRAALSEECDQLIAEYDGEDEIEAAVAARLDEIDAQLAALDNASRTYEPADKARAGVFVVLNHEGMARVECGFIRPQDEPEAASSDDGESTDDQRTDRRERSPAPLSDRLICELAAHRTAALRHALGEVPEIALVAVIHALAVQTFRTEGGSALELRAQSSHLSVHASDIGDSRATRGIEARHAAWASQLPKGSADLWSAILAMKPARRLSLLAHCAAYSVNAVPRMAGRGVMAHAEQLASQLQLDMSGYWQPTAANYFGRVAKPHILAAVTEGASPEAARRIDGMKKDPMAEAAALALQRSGWVPEIMRTKASDDPQWLEAAE